MRAKRAEIFFTWGGGTKTLMGGTQDFLDGGGDRPPWGGQGSDGGRGPPIPPILGNPAPPKNT